MLVPLLALAMMQQEPLRPFTTGTELDRECKTWAALIDNTRELTTSEDYDAGACIGYMDGVTAGLTSMKVACVENASLGTLIRVYLVYVDKHPKVLDMAASAGVYGALREAYPCPTK